MDNNSQGRLTYFCSDDHVTLSHSAVECYRILTLVNAGCDFMFMSA